MEEKEKDAKEGYTYKKIIIFGFIFVFIISSPYLLKFFTRLGVFPEYLSGNLYENDFIDEINFFISFMAAIATIAIAIGAYTQLRSLKESSKNTGKTLQMDFVRHLDKQWCSKETTETRCELWTEYRKAIKRKDDCWPDICEKACKKEVGIKAVQNHVVQIDEKGESEPTVENNKKLFEHLNFLELMGSIYLYRKQEIIDDEMLQNLFAGKLHTYLKFYRVYLNERPTNKPYALKLLKDLDALEAQKDDKDQSTLSKNGGLS